MNRRRGLCLIAMPWATAVAAQPPPAEHSRIDGLIAAVGQRSDIRFLRNGKEYTCAQAADFLRGKLKWRIDKVSTVQDFIDQVGTRSTSSGDIYRVRLADGRVVDSADFLRQELQRISKP